MNAQLLSKNFSIKNKQLLENISSSVDFLYIILRSLSKVNYIKNSIERSKFHHNIIMY